jgi:hypothetical protein
MGLKVRERDNARDSKNAIVEDAYYLVPGDTVSRRQSDGRIDFGVVDLEHKSLSVLLRQTFEMIFYQSGKQYFEAFLLSTTDYTETAGGKCTARKNYDPSRFILPVQVSPHPSAMYAGALLGALLAAVLVEVYRRRSNNGTTRTDGGTEPHVASRIFWRFVRGSVAASIAIFIFQTTSDFKFSLTITVHRGRQNLMRRRYWRRLH